MSLVLSQKVSDGPIHILANGEHIEIRLISVGGNQCRYAFDASDDVVIDRDVIHQRKIRAKGNE